MPFFTVHTPTYNRADYIVKVWKALCDQKYKDFEWIVADDGSQDGTIAILKELKSQSRFPVTIIAADKRVGKTVLDNKAINLAKGHIFLWNDSDDMLTPDALEAINDAWESIPVSERGGYCGITALCEESGKIVSSVMPFSGSFDTTWLDLRHKHKVFGDMLYSCRTDILRQYTPPEVDFCVAESSFWDPIGSKYKTRVISKVLKKIEYNSPDCISFSGKIQYCRGYVYAMAIGWNAISKNRNLNLFDPGLKQLVTYFRYAIHGDINVLNARFMLISKLSLLKLILAFLFSAMLVLKDAICGRVCKTHREFNESVRSAKFTIS